MTRLLAAPPSTSCKVPDKKAPHARRPFVWFGGKKLEIGLRIRVDITWIRTQLSRKVRANFFNSPPIRSPGLAFLKKNPDPNPQLCFQAMCSLVHLQYVQKVFAHFEYKLFYKMGQDFIDIQYPHLRDEAVLWILLGGSYITANLYCICTSVCFMFA